VVFTDVIQMILLTITALYVTVKAFVLRPTVELSDQFLALDLDMPAGLGQSLLHKDPSTWTPIFSVFGVCVALWFMRTVMEGMGGVGGYTDQRFFAARTEREASLLTLEAIVIAVLRWTMVAGLVVMGYHLLAKGGAAASVIGSDAEQVLPVVLSQMLPTGLKGVIVAGLVAAAMSTFDSTLNAGASYIVRDIYHSYIRPDATGKQLMWASRWATVGLCVAGVGIAAVVPNINKIWGLITMGIGAGMFVPLFLRWYWPRFNGYGFACGTAAGIVSALVVNTGLGWPLHMAFPTVVISAFVVSVLSALVTPPVPDKVLVAFYTQINPWGFWGRVSGLARQQGQISDEQAHERLWEKLNDVIAVCFSVPFQMCILLAGMSFVFRAWTSFAFLVAVTVVCGLGLYFFWYRNLKSDEACKEDDAHYEQLAQEQEAGSAG
jgi:Na+/proline symporter